MSEFDNYTDDRMGEEVDHSRIVRRLLVQFDKSPEEARGVADSWHFEAGGDHGYLAAWKAMDEGQVTP